MADNYLRLYVHFVWATWDRLPLIEPAWESALYHEIHSEVHEMGAKVLELGGIENHLHLLLRFTATHSMAGLIKQIKGSSAFFVNRHGFTHNHFKWQGGYAALTVSQWHLTRVANYIRNQKQHHAQNTTKLRMEFPDKFPFKD